MQDAQSGTEANAHSPNQDLEREEEGQLTTDLSPRKLRSLENKKEHAEQREKEAEEKAAKKAELVELRKAQKAESKKHTERLKKVASMFGGGGGGELPLPELSFGVLDNGNGTMNRIFQHMPDKTIRFVSEAFVRSAMAHYFTYDLGSQFDAFRFYKHMDLDNCFKYFFVETPRTPEHTVRFISQKSTEGLTFDRLPFDFKPQASLSLCPTFTRLLSGCEYGVDSLLCFIGSVFDETSDNSQYLYLFGEGGSGKSTLTAFLQRIMPFGSTVTTPPKFGDRFFYSTIVGKRLVFFGDVDNYNTVKSPEIKTLTGDGTVFVDIKGEGGYTCKMNTKLVLCSNHEPGASSKKSDVRRLIPVRMKAPISTLPVAEMARLLDAEANEFLSVCWLKYKELGIGATMPVDAEEVQNIISSNEDLFEDAANTWLIFDADLSLSRGELNKIGEQQEWNHGTLSAFKNWLLDKEGVRYLSPKLRGRRLEYARRATYGVGVRAAARKSFGSPTPQIVAYSKRIMGEWKSLIEGLGHKFDVSSFYTDEPPKGENILIIKDKKNLDSREQGHNGEF